MLGLENFIEKDTFLVGGLLILVALAALLSERSGIINIALEGQLIAATLGYTICSFFIRKQGWNEYGEYLLAFLGAIAFVLVITLCFGFFVINMRMNQILTAIAINIFMLGFANLMIVFLKDSAEIAVNSDYLSLFNSKEIDSYLIIKKDDLRVFEIAYQFFFVIVIVLGINFFLFRTKPGLHLRACGESPAISRMNGISVKKYRYFALLTGGILIGFAGTLFAEWKPGFDGSGDGFGYLGLAILILGMRNIFWICFFSFVFTISQTVVFTTTSATYKELINSINYVAPLAVLTVYGIFWKQKSGKNAPPRALGRDS